MEEKFMISQGDLRIPCKLTEPVNDEIRRIVLSVHGLGGSMEDDIQVGMADEMSFFYSVTFRFDFPGHGENPTNELTLDGCVDTLLAVAREARCRYPDVEDLCIFATGFGAYMTLVGLQELLEMPGRVKLVIQTPSLRMDETLLNMKGMSRETFRVMDKMTFRAKRPLEVSYSFYEELRLNPALSDFPIPMLILHGEEDAYIPMSDIQILRQMNEDAKLVIIPGTSHRFMEEGAWDMVLDLTRDWFEFEQVLLSDWA